MTLPRDLYQEVILDHGRRPRNRDAMPDADLEAEGNNPLCGDHVAVRLKTSGETIEEIRFEGSGCLVSIASASLMTEKLRGKSANECRELADVVAGLTAGAALPDGLEALGGVVDFPMRIRCATLPWRTLRAALDGESGRVTTE
jgi:nitrogen fixation NifU-like protein